MVFAYHNVGVRCLKVLLDADVDVALVVTHEDSSTENIWFGSVSKLAAEESIRCITPTDPNSDEVIAIVATLQPDFIFSFYYRQMLSETLLKLPIHGAFNMHGSLLPHYRGRAPVNWAVLHGERVTGASLHYMVAKPDAGDLVAQTAVPILKNDTAGEVFEKVTVAAEMTLWKVLPDLLALKAPREPLDLKSGSYFGGRKPEDGRIDWHADIAAAHNLIRAVAPPYPGAWFDLRGHRFEVHEARPVSLREADLPSASRLLPDPTLYVDGESVSVLWPTATARATTELSADSTAALRLLKILHAGRPCPATRLRELLSVTDARALIALCEDNSS